MLTPQELNRIKEALCFYLPYDIRCSIAEINEDGFIDDMEGDDMLLMSVGHWLAPLEYIDVDVEYDNAAFEYTGYQGENEDRSELTCFDYIPYLHLRPFDSLTDIEREESMRLSMGDRFTYLLSKHIDLFNLIADDLAIDDSPEPD